MKDQFISHRFSYVWKSMDETGIPSVWGKCRYPVFFDFSNNKKDLPESISQYLWCLMPKENYSLDEGHFLLRFTKEEAIRLLKKRGKTSAIGIQKKLEDLNRKDKEGNWREH